MHIYTQPVVYGWIQDKKRKFLIKKVIRKSDKNRLGLKRSLFGVALG